MTNCPPGTGERDSSADWNGPEPRTCGGCRHFAPIFYPDSPRRDGERGACLLGLEPGAGADELAELLWGSGRDSVDEACPMFGEG